MTRLLLLAIAALALGAGAVRADELFQADKAWYQGYTEKAVNLYQVAALHGDKIAQRRLGDLYASETPIGPPAYPEAFKWYRMAATQGDAPALDGLALMYRDGNGVPQDYAEALKLLHRAAGKGLHLAKYHLGQMYGAGQGVPRDTLRAYMWVSLGAVSYATDVIEARDTLARDLTKQQIAEAQKLAESCQLQNFRNCD